VRIGRSLTRRSGEDIIEAARKAQAGLDHSISLKEFIRFSGIRQHEINRAFPEGRWTEVKRLAGLDAHQQFHPKYTDEDLLRAYHAVVEATGRIPTWAIMDAKGTVSHDVLARRFGGMEGTLRRYRAWLLETRPESTRLELLPESPHETPIPPAPEEGGQSISTEKRPRAQGTVFGRPMNFRGLRHAPINEQGVVFLFGMIAYELGFIVESVQQGFPDCEAKRALDGTGGRWQRVRIEFEFESRTFRDHAHDPKGADLVVCWENNWPECPVEVLELRTAIRNLQG
jgi:HNH endonuclease